MCLCDCCVLVFLCDRSSIPIDRGVHMGHSVSSWAWIKLKMNKGMHVLIISILDCFWRTLRAIWVILALFLCDLPGSETAHLCAIFRHSLWSQVGVYIKGRASIVLIKLYIKLLFFCLALWNACGCVLAMGPQGTGRQKQCRTVADIAGNFGIYGQ